MASHISHAGLPYPVKNARFTVRIGFRVVAGTPTDPTTPDTEISTDGGATFTDCTEEITTGGGNGLGFITLTATEMNNTTADLAAKSANCTTSLMLVTPRNLPILQSGTAQAGAAGSITLAAGAAAFDLSGCIVRTTGGTGGGTVNNQARVITAYNTSTKVATVLPTWETNPSSDTTYDILLTEVGGNAVTGVAPTTGSIATAVWTDTTASDFTTALSVGKSVMNGVTLGTGLTVNAVTTDVGITQTGADKVWGTTTRLLTAGTNIVLAKGVGVTGFNDITAAAAATAIWTDLFASSDFSTVGSVGAKLKLFTVAATSGGVTLADGVAHGGTPGASTATFAMANINVTNPAGNAFDIAASNDGIEITANNKGILISADADVGIYVSSNNSDGFYAQGGGSGGGFHSVPDAIGFGGSSGTVDANVVSIDGELTNSNNATLNLRQLNIQNDAGPTILLVASDDSGHCIDIQLTGASNDFNAVNITTDNGHGIHVSTVAGHTLFLEPITALFAGVAITSAGDGINIAGTDNGIKVSASAGPAVYIPATGSNHAVVLSSVDGHCISLAASDGGNAVDIYANNGYDINIINDGNECIQIQANNGIAVFIDSTNAAGAVTINNNTGASLNISSNGGPAILLSPLDGNGIDILPSLSSNPSAMGINIDMTNAGTGNGIVVNSPSGSGIVAIGLGGAGIFASGVEGIEAVGTDSGIYAHGPFGIYVTGDSSMGISVNGVNCAALGLFSDGAAACVTISAGTGNAIGIDIVGGATGGEAIKFEAPADVAVNAVGATGGVNVQTAAGIGLQISGDGVSPDFVLSGNGLLQADLGGKVIGNTATAFAGVGVEAELEDIESGFTFVRTMRIVAAAVAGLDTGGPGSPIFVGLTGVERFRGTADTSGNRNSVVYAP